MSGPTLRCENNLVLEQYRRMRADGITDNEINHGTWTLRTLTGEKTKRIQEGAGDDVITCEEIIDTAVNHAERYSDFLERLTGRKVPWLLSGETKQKAEEAKTIILRDIAAQGLNSTSPEYKKLLAVGLYMFAQTPTNSELATVKKFHPSSLTKIAGRLEYLGLHTFQKWLVENGGLGLSTFPSDSHLEATAGEALSAKRGACTERSKILYALFKEAGLDTSFVHMTSRESKEAWIKSFGFDRPAPISPRDYLIGHVAVEVNTGSESIFFEPNTVEFGNIYQNYGHEISPRELYQMDISNLTGNVMDTDPFNPETADTLLAGGMALGSSPQIPLLHLIKGVLMMKMDKFDDAFACFEKALLLNPDLASARILYCRLLLKANRWQELGKCMARLPEDSSDASTMKAMFAAHDGRISDARRYIEESLEKGADRYTGYIELAKLFVQERKYAEAEEYFRRAIQLNWLEMSTYDGLLATLGMQKKDKDTVEVLRQIFSINPMSTPHLILMTNTLMKLGRKEEARQYYRRTVLSLPSLGKFGYAEYEAVVDLASKFGEWELVAKTAGACLQAGNIAVGTILLYIDGASHFDKQECASKFGALLQYLEAVFKTEYPNNQMVDGRFTRIPGVPNKSVPPVVYWRLAAVAKRLSSPDAWRLLRDFCEKTLFVPEFVAYSTHAAWMNRSQSDFQETLTSWDRFLSILSDTGPAQTDDEALTALAKIAEAIGQLPQEMLKDPALHIRFERCYNLLCATYTHRQMSAKAIETEMAATRLGFKITH